MSQGSEDVAMNINNLASVDQPCPYYCRVGMAANDTTHLPVIVIEKAQSSNAQRPHKATRTTNAVQLPDPASSWRMRSRPAFPRPGDVYRGRRAAAADVRPLGLLPNRRGLDAWRELTMLLSSLPPSAAKPPAPAPAASKQLADDRREEQNKPTITATVAHRRRAVNTSERNALGNRSSGFRVAQGQQGVMAPSQQQEEGQCEDTEYLDMLAKCNIHKYLSHQDKAPPRLLVPVGAGTGQDTAPQQSSRTKRLTPSAKLQRFDHLSPVVLAVLYPPQVLFRVNL